MKPIVFSCRDTIPLLPDQIAEQILDLDRWPEFGGYGMLPGIEKAEFEIRTPEIVGSRFRVTNTDGSNHLEEIVEWEPERRLQLRLSEFSAPLSKLASSFDEIWEFSRDGDNTQVVRSMQIHGKSVLTRPLLWIIARLLRKAIAKHLQQMREAADVGH